MHSAATAISSYLLPWALGSRQGSRAHPQPPVSGFFAILVIIIFSSFFQPPFVLILAPFWLQTWRQSHLKKSDLGNYQHVLQIPHPILMVLADPRSLKVVIPSRREAIFLDFGFHLLYRFSINFRLHFWMAFGTMFASKSLQHGIKNVKKNYSDFGSHFYRFLLDFGLHLGTHVPPKSFKIRRGS